MRSTSVGGVAKELVTADEGLLIYELVLRCFLAPEEFGDADGVSTAVESGNVVISDVVINTAPSSSSSSSSSSASPPSFPGTHPSSSSSSSEPSSEEENKEEEKPKDERPTQKLHWISPKIDGRIRIIGK